MSQHDHASHDNVKNSNPCAGHAGCSPMATVISAPVQPGVAVYRIATMDCAAKKVKFATL